MAKYLVMPEKLLHRIPEDMDYDTRCGGRADRQYGSRHT